ncbi:Protein gts1 [Savitreella phatthalungensis]
MRQNGNTVSNYNLNPLREWPLREDDAGMEQFIRDKYETKRFTTQRETGSFRPIKSAMKGSSAVVESTEFSSLAARFAREMSQLRDMGFTNRSLVIKTLSRTGGDVAAATEQLLDQTAAGSDARASDTGSGRSKCLRVRFTADTLGGEQTPILQHANPFDAFALRMPQVNPFSSIPPSMYNAQSSGSAIVPVAMPLKAQVTGGQPLRPLTPHQSHESQALHFGVSKGAQHSRLHDARLPGLSYQQHQGQQSYSEPQNVPQPMQSRSEQISNPQSGKNPRDVEQLASVADWRNNAMNTSYSQPGRALPDTNEDQRTAILPASLELSQYSHQSNAFAFNSMQEQLSRMEQTLRPQTTGMNSTRNSKNAGSVYPVRPAASEFVAHSGRVGPTDRATAPVFASSASIASGATNTSYSQLYSPSNTSSDLYGRQSQHDEKHESFSNYSRSSAQNYTRSQSSPFPSLALYQTDATQPQPSVDTQGFAQVDQYSGFRPHDTMSRPLSHAWHVPPNYPAQNMMYVQPQGPTSLAQQQQLTQPVNGAVQPHRTGAALSSQNPTLQQQPQQQQQQQHFDPLRPFKPLDKAGIMSFYDEPRARQQHSMLSPLPQATPLSSFPSAQHQIGSLPFRPPSTGVLRYDTPPSSVPTNTTTPRTRPNFYGDHDVRTDMYNRHL